MAFSKQIHANISEMPQPPRISNYSFYDKLPTLFSSPSSLTPLPGMSVFSHKRRHDDIEDLPVPPFKPPKISFQTPLAHSCSSGCQYCSSLTNLDIAAFYWSMLAMRGYPEIKTSSSKMPLDLKIPPPPSPTFSIESFPKPPSPSGSLSSLDSEPLSPTSSVSSESSMKNFSIHKYQCQVCHKSYSHPRLLNRHLQSHTPYKKHHCPRCRKGFNDAFDLKRHIRTHTGIKPFQCRLCEKSFTQRCSLEAHMTRVHNITQQFGFRERRPKVFVCEDCGQTFPDNNTFRQHEKECADMNK